MSQEPVTAVCWGAGWDSTAMLIEMVRRGIRPAVITFADTGGELPGTYEFIPLFQQYLRDHDFPEAVVCRYAPGRYTQRRYRDAVRSYLTARNIVVGEDRFERLSMLYGSLLYTQSLPGSAFGKPSCAVRWKAKAQEPVRRRCEAVLTALNNGQVVRKAIGFDATETKRNYNAEVLTNPRKLYPSRWVPRQAGYTPWYPLQEWGIDRAACGRIITAAGLPLPPKSGCFFCPRKRREEVQELARTDPQSYALALLLEDNFHRDASAPRYHLTVRNKETDAVCATFNSHAQTSQAARADFLHSQPAYRDTRQYAVRVRSRVRGLGRSWNWRDVIGEVTDDA